MHVAGHVCSRTCWLGLYSGFPEVAGLDKTSGWSTRCGCVYSICVKLLAANRSTVIAEFKANPDRLEKSNDAQYHQVSYRFRQYGRGVRYVHFLHRGKDILYWAGYYGARITNSTVMVKLN
ncbi:F-box only protein 6-like [Terrapene carolina triunguis]|uniref:F-box only protein 6-like n=1 Tax=Terrapene triunguis TaxID=2587831 RepID=UPI0011561C09|nr:F-box only protein 6-like [Terrapene carolina triunguis]